jgi:hypothetical protein
MPTGFFFAMQNVVSVVRNFRNVRKSVQVCKAESDCWTGHLKVAPTTTCRSGPHDYLPITIRSRRLTGS